MATSIISFTQKFQFTGPVLITALMLQSAEFVYAQSGMPPDPGIASTPIYHQLISPNTDYDSTSGSFVYDYNIPLPAGIGGHTPTLSLLYNSHARTDVMQYGVGWSDTIPHITLSTRMGVDQMYASPMYISSMDGELKSTTDTIFRAEVDKGNFRTYNQSYPNTWVVTDKDGTVHTFASHQADAADPTRIYRWYLTTSTDANDNTITYTYTTNDGQIYPETISYGSYTVMFNKEVATQARISYRSGFLVKTDERINQVTVQHNGSTIATHDIAYVDNRISEITPKTDVILPSEKYSYSDEDSMDRWVLDDRYTTVKSWYHGLNTVFTDINGDSIADHFLAHRVVDGRTFYEFKLGTGSGWSDIPLSDNWFTSMPAFNTTHPLDSTMYLTHHDENTASFAEVTGDGLPDIVNGYSSPLMKMYENTGTGWQFGYDILHPLMESNNYFRQVSSRNVRYIDINGDGLNDFFLLHSRWNHGRQFNIKLNNGNGFDDILAPQSNGHYQDVPGIGDLVGRIDHSRLYFSSDNENARATATYTDVNGDGLFDLVWLDEGVNRFYLNTGSGWVHEVSFDTPGFTYVDHQNEHKIIPSYVDITGDGLPEQIVSHATNDNSNGFTHDIKINTGAGWMSVDITNLWLQTLSTEKITLTWDNGGAAAAEFADVNADGLVDLVNKRHENDTNCSSNSACHGFHVNQAKVSGLLTKIEHGTGGVTDITYSTAALQSVTNKVPFPVHVVDSITHNPGISSGYSKSFLHEEGHYYQDPDDVFDRRFAGFGQVTRTTDLSREITHYHQGNDLDLDEQEGIDVEALIGQPYKAQVINLSGHIYSTTRFNYDLQDLGDGATFVALKSQIDLQFDGDSDHKDTAVSYIYDPNHGSPLTITEYGQVDANFDGTFTDVGSDSRTTTYTYATSSAGVVVPVTGVLTDVGGNRVTEAHYYYDNLPLGTVSNGNLTRRSDWVTASDFVDQYWTYDTFGNVWQAVDRENSITTYQYDSYNLYPSVVTNALDQITGYEYDYRTGQVGRTTDVNQQQFVSTYDGFGRPKTQSAPDPQSGQLVLQTTWQYTDTPGSVSIKTTNYLSANVKTETYTYLDGFGNTIQERSSADDTNEFVVKDYQYGENGLLVSESLPYFDNGSGRTTAIEDTDRLIVYEYDALERVISTVTAVGETTTEYDQWSATVTDTLNNDKIFTYDAFDRLAQVTEFNDGDSYETHYEYSSLDLLTKITDAESNTRNISYDGLGRRTVLEDLHQPITNPLVALPIIDITGVAGQVGTGPGAITTANRNQAIVGNSIDRATDDSFGVWQFFYDGVNLTETIDPIGTTISYDYDELHRLRSEDSDTTPEIDQLYTYDACAYGIGRLCTVTTPAVETAFTYTANGLVETESIALDSDTYAMTYNYDRQGNQTALTYPDDSVVQYSYGSAGLVNQVAYNEANGSSTSLINEIDYGPHRLPTVVDRANGLTTTTTYDASELHRLRSIYTDGPTSEIAVGSDPSVNARAFMRVSDQLSSEVETDVVSVQEQAEQAAPLIVGIVVDTEPEEFVISSDTSVSDQITILEIQSEVESIEPQVIEVNSPTSTPETTNPIESTGVDLAAEQSRSKGISALERSVAAGDGLPNLTYTYDEVGNIKKIIDGSATDSYATTTYGYDNLYRLTSAITDATALTPYNRSYQYDPLGNIINKSDVGTYEYTQAGYANPHAATAVAGVSYYYDKNGNLLSTGDGLENIWNYRNELITSTQGDDTVEFINDHTGRRVMKDDGDTVTSYPFASFKITDTGSTTKHIYAGDLLVVTIDGVGENARTYYNHHDHLGSTKAVTDEAGAVTQNLTYYPFGAMESDQQFTNQNQTKRYTGHDYDEETDLSYMGARYYAGDNARFTSQDPVALALGDWKTVKDKTDGKLDFYLQNPQTHNSYSYTANNPLKFVDKNGEYIEISGSAHSRGFSGSAGVRFSNKGFNVVGSVGLGGGSRSFPLSVSYVPGEDVVHVTTIKDTIGFSIARYIGFGVEQSGELVNNTFQAESENVSIRLGFGADVYARREISIPILVRTKHDLTLEPSSSPHSTPNFVPAPISNTYLDGREYQSVISAPKRRDEENRD